MAYSHDMTDIAGSDLIRSERDVLMRYLNKMRDDKVTPKPALAALRAAIRRLSAR